MKSRTSGETTKNRLLEAALLAFAALCVAIGWLAYEQRWILLSVVAVLTLAAAITAFYQIVRISRTMSRCLSRVVRRLSTTDRQMLESSPFCIVSVSEKGEVLWYNHRFLKEVLNGTECIGSSADEWLTGTSLLDLSEFGQADVSVGQKQYTVVASKLTVDKTPAYLLYYWDDTDFKVMSEEYKQSRSAALSIYIDNLDELGQTVRDSERMQMVGRVETLLEDWIGSTTGVICKYDNGRFLAVVERRHVEQMEQDRFSILDKVRQLQVGETNGLTLSIGVGEGASLRDSLSMARQALEMALGRGGDQVAVKTEDGFDFYGGATKDVERRAKVRSRMMASALKDMIEACDRVVLMGHRFSDADCVGAAMGLAAAARMLERPAFVAIDRTTTLAPDCLTRYTPEEQTEWIVDEKAARNLITGDTLLIVCDTHNRDMLEFPSLYDLARNVVVIDHHRRMVDCMDDAVLFYLESTASSTCELATELIGYMLPRNLARREAEGLLAGIVLDTHNFVLKSGVSTFEAAATLKQAGADTVSVKRMLSGSMELYRAKTEILSHAEVKDKIAFSCAPSGGKEQRLAAAQAADELLSIQDVEAAFVLLPNGNDVNISARSYGEFNVHLTMEAMGGGGHMTMAGTHMKDVSLETAKDQLMKVIEKQRAEAATRLSESADHTAVSN